MSTVFILKNYNRFVIQTEAGPKWDHFYIHRFDTDFRKLAKFESTGEAQAFLDKHPDLESSFDAWIVSTDTMQWGIKA